jgi:hypothetical protein
LQGPQGAQGIPGAFGTEYGEMYSIATLVPPDPPTTGTPFIGPFNVINTFLPFTTVALGGGEAQIGTLNMFTFNNNLVDGAQLVSTNGGIYKMDAVFNVSSSDNNHDVIIQMYLNNAALPRFVTRRHFQSPGHSGSVSMTGFIALAPGDAIHAKMAVDRQVPLQVNVDFINVHLLRIL